jgi:hypothetical protein
MRAFRAPRTSTGETIMRASYVSSALFKDSIAAVCILLSLTFYEPARAATVIGLCRTGWDVTCTVERGGQDPNYFLSSKPKGAPGHPCSFFSAESTLSSQHAC